MRQNELTDSSHTITNDDTPPTPRRCHRCAAAGALKSGFTRTGKRTLGGLVDDGVKSCVRYYLNNFKVCGGWRGTLAWVAV